MSDFAIRADRLLDLAEAVLARSATDSDFVELNSLLLLDEATRQRYLKYCLMHVALRVDLRAGRAIQKAHQQISVDTDSATYDDLDDARLETLALPPAPIFLSATFHNTFGYFPEGMPLAYLIATVVTGLGLLIGSVIHVAGPTAVARQVASLPSPLSPLPSVVGRVTGMVDCKWAEEGVRGGGRGAGAGNPTSYILHPKSLVALGDNFALASGLMEITYDTGAKVILQGPVTYEVETNGGYLAVGKLTGKLEKKVASGQWSVASNSGTSSPQPLAPSPSSNPQSPIPNPSLSTIHYPLFTIRTPTATVTDLGTEFGVEVNATGCHRSECFRRRDQDCAGRGLGPRWGGPDHSRRQCRSFRRQERRITRTELNERQFVRSPAGKLPGRPCRRLRPVGSLPSAGRVLSHGAAEE